MTAFHHGLLDGDLTMTNLIKNFWNDEEGATAIEYGLIAGLIAVGIIASLTILAEDLSTFFEGIAKKLPTVV